jgi:hypothetical protein
MSTTPRRAASRPQPPGSNQVERPAERALFRALLDDAAVFAPRLAPLPQAVTDHLALASSPYPDLVGPLLVPPSTVEELLGLPGPQPLEVALVARPGTDLRLVSEARTHLAADPGLRLTGIELGWSSDWRQALTWGAPLCVEVFPGTNQERALSDLQEHANGSRVQAKFRTGSTPDTRVPTATELASFIRACVDHDLAFKLTGALHHAIGHTTAEGEDQFGFLNVIAATRWALAHGAEVPEMESILSRRDPAPILDIVTRMSEADASVVRAFFTAYGCCDVMDPIGDLLSLGLLEEAAV